MSSLVDHIRSSLTDPNPPWESVLPEAKTIIRLCLGCRSESRVLDKLQVLGKLNQCLSALALRGQWNNQVDDYIHRNIQHPTGWIKLLTGKGTKLTDNEAISELISFYQDTWNKFQRWEKDQQSSPAPESTSTPEAGEQETLPAPVPVAAVSSVVQPLGTGSANFAAVPSTPQKSREPAKGFDPAALHEGNLYPGNPALPWSTPRYTQYRGLKYALYGGPPDPQSREYQFWHVVFTDKRPVQSAEAFSSPVTANFAARNAIDTLMGNAAPEPAPTTNLKRGNKRGKMRKLEARDRCDHCKKWVSWGGQGRSRESLGTLEGIVSPGVNINWAVCDRCFKQKGTEAQYWDGWFERQESKLQENS